MLIRDPLRLHWYLHLGYTHFALRRS